ncbi:hypothetical protein Tco_1057547 [Tanacetum coccineum]|uniref:Uncharacterized protein n=1 Tax=Tanacetum coccineum TaxID=301880 RepID=A0ABQ5H7A9_9ASTR
MTTPCLTLYPTTTPRTKVFDPFVIISNSDDEITTLPIRPAPPSSAHTGLTASTSVVHPPPTRPLPTRPAFARRPRKEISMPLGYKVASDRWRTASPSTCHPLIPLEIPSLSLPPLLWTSSSSPPPSLLPSLSRKRSRLPPPSLPSSVSPLPPPIVVPPTPEHVESVRDNIETLRASLASAIQETMTLRARAGSLKQHNVVTRESLRIARGKFIRSQI